MNDYRQLIQCGNHGILIEVSADIFPHKVLLSIKQSCYQENGTFQAPKAELNLQFSSEQFETFRLACEQASIAVNVQPQHAENPTLFTRRHADARHLLPPIEYDGTLGKR